MAADPRGVVSKNPWDDNDENDDSEIRDCPLLARFPRNGGFAEFGEEIVKVLAGFCRISEVFLDTVKQIY